MEILEKLFDSPVRTKLLKLFLMNPDKQFSSADASRQAGLRTVQFSREARRLLKLHILKAASARVIPERLASGRKRPRSRRAPAHPTKVFFANKEFPLFAELRHLMIKSAPHAKGPLTAKIKRLGAIRLAILAGVFIDNPASRVDLFIVGDGLKKARMKSFIQWLEAEVGKELNYVAMSSFEFKYRMDMYDRFVRDILEFPHETVINKLGV